MRKKNKRKIKDYLFEIFFVFINVFIVLLFYKNILLTTIFVSIIAVTGLIKWKSRRTLIIFILGGLAGALVEMICIYFGIWEYSITNFFNIPFWLFIVWGNATAVIYQVANKIKEKRMELK